MPDIVLTTLNAKYAHASFGLRYLMANLGELRERAEILEFEISQKLLDVVEAVLAREPKIVGVGVYIWNAEQALRVDDRVHARKEIAASNGECDLVEAKVAVLRHTHARDRWCRGRRRRWWRRRGSSDRRFR